MHELVAACASAGLPLHRTLTEMLGEDPSHRTERRGCGYTQATRFLATYVNQPRAAESAGELAVFREWRIGAVEELARALEAAGYTNLAQHFHGNDAYSYVFDGQWGYLDYVLASSSALAGATGVAEVHINADEPSVLDYNTNFKSAGQIAS